jgi:hypothetical protein
VSDTIHRIRWAFTSTAIAAAYYAGDLVEYEKARRRKEIQALADKDDALLYVERWLPTQTVECSWTALPYEDEDE